MTEVLLEQNKSDVQQITSLVTHSFRLSRGKAKLQQEMLIYAGSVLQDSLRESAYDAALEPTIATCKKIFLSPSHHLPVRNEAFSEEQFEEENRTEIGRFVGMLRDSALKADRYANIDLPKLMIGDLINSDAKWLPWKREAENKPQSLRPYVSHIVGYSILGRNTGAPVFDQMYQMVAGELPRFFHANNLETEDYADAFRDVMSGHTDINPQDATAVRDFVAQKGLPSPF